MLVLFLKKTYQKVMRLLLQVWIQAVLQLEPEAGEEGGELVAKAPAGEVRHDRGALPVLNTHFANSIPQKFYDLHFPEKFSSREIKARNLL